MGTRGCVAIGTPDEWKGVYNHFDSYLNGLGCTVWHEWKENPNLPNEVLQFGDWRAYLSGGICKYCGKKTGQPHSITVNKFTMEPGKDPEAKYHEHYDLDEPNYITHDSPDPLFIEWVYVLNDEKQEMYVLAHVGMDSKEYKALTDKPGKTGSEPGLMENGYWDYGHCAYKMVHVATIDMTEDEEPDWRELNKNISIEQGWADPEDFEDYED